MHSNTHAIILAGGSGTRLWPLSRKLFPKQFMPLNGESLFQKTVKRLLERLSPEHLHVVTHQDHVFFVKDQLNQLNAAGANVYCEPEAKNTLPAIAWLTTRLMARQGNVSIGVFPSDHAIHDSAAFHTTWELAQKAARHNVITLLGIKPTRPAVDYGYIELGEPIEANIHRVKSFKEKPAAETAQAYFKGNNHLWNAGMFVFDAHTLCHTLKIHQPKILEIAQELAKSDVAHANPDLFKLFPSLSMDEGLLEKASSNTAVVAASFDWNDLGSWQAMYEHLKVAQTDNVSLGEVLCVDSQNNLFWSDSGLIAAYGVNDLAVVKTSDATLICPRQKSGDLKTLIDQIREKSHALTENHATVHRPWGSFTVLTESPTFKVKKITIAPGARLSKQYHHRREEHWTVVKGTALVEIGNAEFTLVRGESTHIPKGSSHRLSNPKNDTLEIIEVQVGDYLGEDDIVRLEDAYGRAK